MNEERKKDALTDAMQCAHPTAEPSEALVLKVAQLAEAKASALARHTRKNAPWRTFRNVVLATVTLGVASVAALLGPRIYYGVQLNQASEVLRKALFLQATSYRLYPDGSQKKVGEFYRIRKGESIRARLEREDLLAIWQGDSLCQSRPKDSFFECGVYGLWTEDPTNRLQMMAFQGTVFFLRHAARLDLLPDGRLVSQHPEHEERTLIRRDKKGNVTELELQIWEHGLWKPFLRTTLRTNLSLSSELFDTHFPGKKILPPDKKLRYEGVKSPIIQEMRQLSVLLRDASASKNQQRVLELTDAWQKLREQVREIRGEASPDSALWLYRTKALRELGRLDEAREALEQARRNYGMTQQARWFLEEEELLRPK